MKKKIPISPRTGKPLIKTCPRKKIDVKKVEKLAGQGLTKEQICLVLDVGSSTYYRNQKESGELGVAFERGRAKAAGFVTNKLMTLIKQGNFAAIQLYCKTQLNFKETTINQLEGNKDKPIEVKSTSATNISALAAEAAAILALAQQRKDANESGQPPG